MYSEVVDEADTQWIGRRPGGGGSTFVSPTPDYIAPFICYHCTDAATHVNVSVFALGGNNIGLYSDPLIARNITKFGEGPWTPDELMAQAPRGLFQGYRSPAEFTY